MRAIVMVLVIAMAWLPGRGEAPATEGGDLALKRVEAAEKVVRSLEEKLEIVIPTPEFVDLYLDSLKKLCDARLDASVTRKDRVAAAARYVDDAKTIREKLEARKEKDVDQVQLSQCDYAVAVAERVLEMEKKAAEKK